jgi:hypothetical protein
VGDTLFMLNNRSNIFNKQSFDATMTMYICINRYLV